jgi:pentatricopeptide repeat protein
MTDESPHGWEQSWLPWHQALYNWTTFRGIEGLQDARAGQHEKAVELFREMLQKGIIPDRFGFVPLLNACASLGALEEGRRAHEQIIQSGCEADVFVGCSLVDMYAKCGA